MEISDIFIKLISACGAIASAVAGYIGFRREKAKVDADTLLNPSNGGINDPLGVEPISPKLNKDKRKNQTTESLRDIDKEAEIIELITELTYRKQPGDQINVRMGEEQINVDETK